VDVCFRFISGIIVAFGMHLHDAPWLLAIPVFLGAYLLGSIAFSVIICRLFGIPDPRLAGSGNAGATNVLRLGNRKAAAATLIGDLLKGAVAVWVARSISHDLWVLGAAMVGVVLGHLYPIFFHFRGGKGVATSIGVLIGVYWCLGLTVAVVWLGMLRFTRIASVASLSAAVVAPLAAYYFLTPDWIWPISILSALQIWKHRGNIKRLCAGTEPKVNLSKK